METMNASPVYITRHDERKLRKLIDEGNHEQIGDSERATLIAGIDKATIVESYNIPRNVVTMNSQVAIINLESSERQTFSLVFPEDACVDSNKISVLEPSRFQLLGRQVGDEFEWPVPGGAQKFVIAKIVYQPEAWEYRKHNPSIGPRW